MHFFADKTKTVTKSFLIVFSILAGCATSQEERKGEEVSTAEGIALVAVSLPLIVVALPFAVTRPVWEPILESQVESDDKPTTPELANIKYIYSGMNREQIESALGKPERKYSCIRKYAMVKAQHEYRMQTSFTDQLLPFSESQLHTIANAGDSIRIETIDSVVRMKVTGYDGQQYLFGQKIPDSQEIKVAIDQIIDIRVKRPIYMEVWEYRQEQILQGGRYLLFNTGSGEVYSSMQSLHGKSCELLETN